MKLRYIICFFSLLLMFTLGYTISYGQMRRNDMFLPELERDLSFGPDRAAWSMRMVNAARHQTEAGQEPLFLVRTASAGMDTTTEAAFFVTSKDGLLTIYETDRKTVYLHTNIETDRLGQEEQERLRQGFYLSTELELFDYLENCTS